ncbi:MAG: hypothetical protein QM657_04470 [Lacrimispora sp.]|uniref:hypothetical protein n=1 Tax=Lacrimispora sp. TaxID=2719234 RepID=UPI0039E62058
MDMVNPSRRRGWGGFWPDKGIYWVDWEKAIDYFGKIRYTHCNDFIFCLADFFCGIILEILFYSF